MEIQARLANLEAQFASWSSLPDRVINLEQNTGLMGTQLQEYERQQEDWKKMMEHVVSDLIPKLQEFEKRQAALNVTIDSGLTNLQKTSTAMGTQVNDLVSQVKAPQGNNATRAEINDLDLRLRTAQSEGAMLSGMLTNITGVARTAESDLKILKQIVDQLTTDTKARIDGVVAEKEDLSRRLKTVEQGGASRSYSTSTPGSHKYEPLVEKKVVKDMSKFSGDVKSYPAWKAQVELLVEQHSRPLAECLQWLETKKESQVTKDVIQAWADQEDFDRDDLVTHIEEFYHFLAMKTDGVPQGHVLNVARPQGTLRAIRGALAWMRVTDAAGGMTESRRQELSNAITAPDRVKTYDEVMATMEELERFCSELERYSDSAISDGQKMASLRQRLPVELMKDTISHAATLTTYSTLRSFVVQQVSMRRVCRLETVTSGNGKRSSSELNLNQDSESQNHDFEFGGYDNFDQLNYAGKGGTGKGGDKGGSKCYHCGEPGHRRSQCSKFTEFLNKRRASEGWQQGKNGQNPKGFGKGFPQKGGFGKGGGYGFGNYGKGYGNFGKGGFGNCGGYGKGMYEMQTDQFVGQMGQEMWMPGAEMDPSFGGTPWQQPSSQGPGKLFSLNYAEPIRQVKVSNSFEALTNKDDVEDKLLAENLPTVQESLDVDLKAKKMPKWIRPKKKTNKGKDGKLITEVLELNSTQPQVDYVVEGGTLEESREFKGYIWEAVPEPCPGISDAGRDNAVETSKKHDGILTSLNLLVQEHALESPLAHVGKNLGEGMMIRACMDSGAVDSVAPASIAPHVPLQESTGSARGQKYSTADGTSIPNRGEKTFVMRTKEGNDAEVTYQIADISRPLNSVGRICDRGNFVVFESTGGFIVNRSSGARTRFEREDALYMLDSWIPRPSVGDSPPSDFSRQG